MTLNAAAVQEITRTFNGLTNDYMTVQEYVDRHSPDGIWRGDTCGCTDDRCTGFHHAADDRCGCLDVHLDEFAEAFRARQVG